LLHTQTFSDSVVSVVPVSEEKLRSLRFEICTRPLMVALMVILPVDVVPSVP